MLRGKICGGCRAGWITSAPRTRYGIANVLGLGMGGGEKYIEVMMDTKSSEKKCGGNM